MASYPQMQRSFQDVLQDIIGNIQQIIRYEFRLAKTEIKEHTAKVARPVAGIAAGLALAFYAVGFLLLAAVYGLSLLLSAWAAALVVGVVVAVLSAVVVASSAKRLRSVNLTPEKTASTLEENAEWAKHQMK
jgi:Flp pilus assembly protein TadB